MWPDLLLFIPNLHEAETVGPEALLTTLLFLVAALWALWLAVRQPRLPKYQSKLHEPSGRTLSSLSKQREQVASHHDTDDANTVERSP
jgi:hypothetical protein